jgi:hypothetical protein
MCTDLTLNPLLQRPQERRIRLHGGQLVAVNAGEKCHTKGFGQEENHQFCRRHRPNEETRAASAATTHNSGDSTAAKGFTKHLS